MSTALILKLPALHAFESAAQLLVNAEEHPELFSDAEKAAIRQRWEDTGHHPDLFDEMWAGMDDEMDELIDEYRRATA